MKDDEEERKKAQQEEDPWKMVKIGMTSLGLIILIGIIGLVYIANSQPDYNLPEKGSSISCEVCHRDFSDSTNKKYVNRTGMCRQCYKNFCYATGKEFKEY